MTAFVLVHSPLVGPATWAALVPALRARGLDAVAPDLRSPKGAPLWKEHAGSAAAVLGPMPDEPIVLVGHSAAGALLPVIRELSGRAVAAYLFVDAGLPDGTGPRKGNGSFARRLAELHASGHRLLAELRPAPPAFWDETVPVFAGWPDAPCGYLRFVPNPSYDEAATAARARGWPYREIPGGHFHMLVDPERVADALVALANEVRDVRVTA